MRTPLVSIIVPCFNAGRYIAATLESCAQQTWPNIEVIVIDDGSTDDSVGIVKKFTSTRCKLLSQSREGAGAARNKALAAAQGDYIQYLDADDLLHPDKINAQLNEIGHDAKDVLATATFWHFRDDPRSAERRELPIYRCTEPTDFIVCSWLGGGFMQTGGWLLPRALSDAAGAWMKEPCPNDDGEYFTRAVLAASCLRYCPGSHFYYRLPRAGSLASSRDPRLVRSLLNSLEMSCDRLLAREASPRTRAAAATTLFRFAQSYYPEFPALADQAFRSGCRYDRSSWRVNGTLAFRAISRAVGWRMARRIQHARNRMNGARGS